MKAKFEELRIDETNAIDGGMPAIYPWTIVGGAAAVAGAVTALYEFGQMAGEKIYGVVYEGKGLFD